MIFCIGWPGASNERYRSDTTAVQHSVYLTRCASLRNTVIRTGRGLTIAGTRITLYTIVDYLNDKWPPDLIQEGGGKPGV